MNVVGSVHDCLYRSQRTKRETVRTSTLRWIFLFSIVPMSMSRGKKRWEQLCDEPVKKFKKYSLNKKQERTAEQRSSRPKGSAGAAGARVFCSLAPLGADVFLFRFFSAAADIVRKAVVISSAFNNTHTPMLIDTSIIIQIVLRE